MKKKEFLKMIRDKSIPELQKIAADLRKEITKLRFDKMMNKLAKPHLLKQARKNLARVLTIMKEKQLNQNQNNKK